MIFARSGLGLFRYCKHAINAFVIMIGFTVAATAQPTAFATTTAQALTVGTVMTNFMPLFAFGGFSPPTYRVSSGTLPAGLTLDSSSGLVSGTPTATYSTADVVFAASDSIGDATTTSTVSFTVAAAAGPTATADTTAKSLTVGNAMGGFIPLTGSGGTAPLTYYVSSGTLPTGLSLNASTGFVTGTPTATYSAADVVFAVKDANNTVATTTSTVNFTVAAGAGPTAIANTSARSLTVGTAITSFTPLTGSGGWGSLTYYVSSGTLPTGLSLNASTGFVTGTPTATYSAANVVFAVKDANNTVATTTSTVSFTVAAAPGPTATANTTAQSLTVGTAMTSFTPLTGSGGVGSLTYRVSSGTLPAGLTLNSSTGVVSGTPTATYSNANVVFAVRDNTLQDAPTTSTVSFTVAAAAASATSIALTASTTSPQVTANVVLTATITPSAASGTITFKDGSTTIGTGSLSSGVATLTTSFTAGAHSLTATYAATGSYAASTSNTVTVTAGAKPNPATDAKVRSVVFSQLSSVDRVGQSAMDTVQRRLERLHGRVDVFENGIHLTSAPDRLPALAYADPAADLKNKTRGASGVLERKMAADKSVAAKSRNASLLEPAYALWTSGMILVGKEAYDGLSQKSRSTMSSVTAGMDYVFLPGVRAGMAVGISRDTTKIDDNGTSNNGSAVTGTLYASWNVFDTVFLDGLVGYGDVRFKTSRYDANAAATLSGARPASMVFVSLASSWEQRAGALSYAPYLRLDMSKAYLKDYTEQGSANWNLNFASVDMTSQAVAIGLRSRYDLAMSWGTLSPTARLEYRRGVGDAVTQAISYEVDPSTVYNLTRGGTVRNSLTSTLGLSASGPGGIRGTLEYLTSVGGSGYVSNGGRAQLEIRF